MIATITIENAGPIAGPVTLTLNPVGTTEIRGASQAGKSTIAALALWVLTGRLPAGSPAPEDLIHGTAKAMQASITTKAGTTIARRRLRSGKTDRSITKAGTETVTYTTEEAFGAALGKVAQDGALTEAIITPGGWLDLAASTRSEQLRNLLSRALPGRLAVDIVKADPSFRDGDPTDEKGALERRRAANAARDTAAGRHAEAVRAVETAKSQTVDAPSDDEVRAANETIANHAAATKVYAEYTEQLRAHNLTSALAESWDARAAKLGAEPAAVDSEALAALIGEMESIVDPAAPPAPEPEILVGEPSSAERDAAEREAKRLSDLADAADAAQANTKPCSGVESGLCCISARAVDASTAASLAAEQAHARFLEVDDAYTKTRAAWLATFDEVNARNEAARVAFGAAMDRHLEAVDANNDQRLPLAMKIDEMRAALTARNAWLSAAAVLGERPAVAPAPKEPAIASPATIDAAAARDVIRRADTAEAMRAQQAKTIAATELRAATLAAEHETAKATAARLDALVAAIRAAPAVALRESLATLGDIGPVALNVDDAGELSVQIDGRDWRCCTSRGRLAAVSLLFRDALRRAVSMPWCPVVVDDAQSLAGAEYPAVSGPVIVLRGGDGALEVSA